MKGRKQQSFIVISVIFVCLLILLAYTFYLKWQKEKNAFVYEEHWEDTGITVDDQSVTLREFGYYIVKMENEVQEKALIYNAEDPMEYWNLHFSAGLDSGFMSDYAWDYACADCVCDLIFAKKAKQEGYDLSQEGYEQAKIQAEKQYIVLTVEQIEKTGLTMDLLTRIEERRLLVQQYSELVEEDELAAYFDSVMECISGNNTFVMGSQVICSEEMKNNIRMGTITVNTNRK